MATDNSLFNSASGIEVSTAAPAPIFDSTGGIMSAPSAGGAVITLSLDYSNPNSFLAIGVI